MENKHIVIGGGSGFIGTALTSTLRERGDKVTIISRFPGSETMTWSELESKGLPECDAVINLAGKHILNPTERWNDAYVAEVISSRVNTTTSLVDAANKLDKPPEVFISSAGKCFYGTQELDHRDNYPELDEYSEPMGMDFPAELVSLWEAAADHLDSRRIRHIKLRIGIVLGSIGPQSSLKHLLNMSSAKGFLSAIRIPFSLGLGAVLGSGKQPFPWIHINDMVNLIIKTIDDRTMQGKYNGVAPGVVSNRTFVKTFAKKLRRPVLWTLPKSWIRVLVSPERSSILIEGQLVRPKRTLASGFKFKFPDIESALTNLINSPL